MSRIKAALLLCCCMSLLCTSALAESPNLSTVESIRSEEVSYRTAEAEIGSYERFVNMQAAVIFPAVVTLRYEGADAKFIEYKVKRNDMVRAGEVLAVFSTQIDEVALASLKADLERIREDYEYERARRLDEMDDLLAQLKGQTDIYAREVLMLKIERAQTLLDQLDYQHGVEAEALEAEIADMENAGADCMLTAPIDGLITSTHYMHAGDRVPVGEVLITVQSMDHLLLRVNNIQGDFRYGMDVNVYVGLNNEKAELTGRVVGSGTQLPAAQRSEFAYIEIDGWKDYLSALALNQPDRALNIPEIGQYIKPSVSAAACSLDNIVIVPRRAVKQNDGKYMVQKIQDGKIHQRYVNFVMQNSSHAWIVQGVEPGETLIVD